MDRPDPPPQGAGALGAFDAPRIDRAQRRFWLIIDAMIAALVVVAIVGGWAYTHVRGSLRDVRAAGLASLLEAESRGMQLWIEEKKRDAQRWAATPEVQRAAAALAQRARGGEDCAAAPQRELQGEIAPYARLEETALFNLISREGRIISSPHRDYCGRTVAPAFLRQLSPVFEGGTVFVRPWAEADRVGAPPADAPPGPLVWVETPVHGPDGAVVAALGFGRIAAERFAKLLKLAGAGTTRDAYAFDEDGRILTETRFAAQARAPHAAREASGELTRLAAAALQRSEGDEGVLLEPYRNYRGAEVIGAWRWLPEARMAIAVEVDAGEAYAPLAPLRVAFGVLLALVLLSMGTAAATSLWAVRLRMREAKRVGQYRIERQIGEGGMSHVYLARHAHLRRLAAVKVLKPHLATDEVVTRFQREAQLCSRLSHPNTVEIYDYGSTRDGRWYYAMEYLRGISLEKLVRHEGPMPLARALHALRHACGSLQEAHDRGWVHRDVKPDNIMLCARGGQHDVVKVLDFGLIKKVRNPDTRDITQYAKVLGTPMYMAPERLRNPADADARADIYALGAVAWFVLAGRPVFEAETDHDIVYRVMNEDAPSLAAAVPGIAAPLDALVARCLAKDRERRPGGIDEVRAVLDALAARAPWTEADARAWWLARADAAGIAPPEERDGGFLV